MKIKNYIFILTLLFSTLWANAQVLSHKPVFFNASSPHVLKHRGANARNLPLSFVTIARVSHLKANFLNNTITDVSALKNQNSLYIQQIEKEGFSFSQKPKVFPSQDKYRLRFHLKTKGDTKVILYNTLGKVVFQDMLRNFSGSYHKDLYLKGVIREGLYVLKIIQNKKEYARRIVIS